MAKAIRCLMTRVPFPTGALKRLAPIACAATLLSACGGSGVLDPAATVKFIDDFVVQHTGKHPVDTRCPSGIPATVGRRLNCHFIGPEGPYTAYLRIVTVDGRRVVFLVHTQPSSWPAPTLR
jgi:hypothetical protein